MKTLILTAALLSSTVQAYDPSLLEPYNPNEPYPVRLPDPAPRYQAEQPVIIAPIPPSESGPSYYTPSGVMTDKQFCNPVVGGGLRCYTR